MATELGQAYVQIVPSAKGISGSIQKQLDPEASAAGQSAGSKIGSGLKIAAIAAVAAVGATLGKIISSSISEGADLQQSFGGIETLFKGSADKVKKYANEAYKTAGLSANAYMENVTSFSASLLQSVGGNTEKAADIANMAMIDMSDNANKMGTNMQDIQNAYQGFAKQNYTMLDNLKLGYGGTKTEMERLLADATKLTGVKYDINNLSDVYSAIHAVQEKLDITGTTAKESADTFSGSLASMKAAASNVLGKMSLGMDISSDLNALASTISTFLFKNFIPMIGNVLKSLPGAIVSFVQTAGPQFMAAGQQIVSQLTSGISQSSPQLSNALSSIFGTVGPLIFENLNKVLGQLPALFQTVVSTISPIISTIGTVFSKTDFSGIQNLISQLIPAIQAGFTSMMQIVGPAIENVVNAFVNLWNAAQPLITVLASALVPAFQVIGSFLGGFFKGILDSVAFAFNAVKVAIDFLTPVITVLVNGFKAISPVLQTVASWVGQVIGFFTSMGGSANSLGSIVKSAWSGIKSGVQSGWSLIQTAINAIKSLFSAMGSAGSALGSIIKSIWSGISSAISSSGGIIKGIISAVKSAFSAMGSTFSNVGGKIKGIVSSITSTLKNLANINLMEAGKAIINGFLSGLKSAYEGVKTFIGGIADWIKEHKGPIRYDKKLLIPNGNALMTSLNTGLIAGFKTVQNNVSGMANQIAGQFDSVTPLVASELEKFKTDDIELNMIKDLAAQISGGNSEIDVNSDNQTNTSLEIIIGILYQILEKDPDILLDGDSIVEKLKERISQALDKMSKDAVRNSGLQIKPS